MVIIKTAEEIEKISISARLVATALQLIKLEAKPGTSTLKLNKLAEEFVYDNDATPSFKGYRGFPYSICSSRNDEVVHGFPSDIPLESGTLLSIDFGVLKNGYHGDAAITFGVGRLSTQVEKLKRITEECLYRGIEQAVPGNRVGDISYAIQTHAENNKFGVVRHFVGHGIGRSLHEKPQIPNVGQAAKGLLLKEGMVLAIEPMLTLGTHEIKTMLDGWTVKTKDGSYAAHFEHTIVVTKYNPKILSLI